MNDLSIPASDVAAGNAVIYHPTGFRANQCRVENVWIITTVTDDKVTIQNNTGNLKTFSRSNARDLVTPLNDLGVEAFLVEKDGRNYITTNWLGGARTAWHGEHGRDIPFVVGNSQTPPIAINSAKQAAKHDAEQQPATDTPQRVTLHPQAGEVADLSTMVDDFKLIVDLDGEHLTLTVEGPPGFTLTRTGRQGIASNSDTGEAAAVTGKTRKLDRDQKRRVEQVLKQPANAKGLTKNEISRYHNETLGLTPKLSSDDANRRADNLRADKKVIVQGKRRCSVSGNPCQLWVHVDHIRKETAG